MLTRDALFSQVDLHGWIHILNVIDAAFHHLMLKHSKSLLLVPPIQDPKRMRRRGYVSIQVAPASVTSFAAAETLQDIQSNQNHEVHAQLAVLLQFTAILLRNATGKSLYLSVHYLTDLLGAADDSTADLALAALRALALPPRLAQATDPRTTSPYDSYCTNCLWSTYALSPRRVVGGRVPWAWD